MEIKKKVKRLLLDSIDRLRIMRKRHSEIKKFTDPRRVEIFNKIALSSTQKAAIDTFFLKNYGKKIPYTWHRHFTAYTGNFDVKYFPELLFIPEFEHFENSNPAYAEAFRDKNVLPLLAKSLGIQTPKLIVSCINGSYHDAQYNIITRSQLYEILQDVGVVFAKPSVDSSSGKNCSLLCLKGGIDTYSGKKIQGIIDDLGCGFCIQECISMHPSLSCIYPHSVNTFRIITYIWHGNIVSMPTILRIGRGGNHVDNAHAGGMFIAVSDDGVLHEKAFTEFKEEYTKHPDTHLVFKGHKIEGVSQMIQTAKRMHAALTQVGTVNWDFTIDKQGEPVLVEANINGGSIWLIEMAHGVGAFGENTGEVLQWMKTMKKLPKSRRNQTIQISG